MSPDSLLRQFEVMADAPNGVQKLRELILQLAVRGKLVPQDPSDEPASVLLERIAAEKQRLVKEGKIKKPKPLPPVRANEAPFEAPERWEWVRVGEAMNLVNGRAFKPTDWSTAGLPIVRIQNLNNAAAPFNYCDFEVSDKFYIDDEDLLLSWSGTPGTSFGAFVWRRGRAVLNQHIFRCELYGGAYVNEFVRLAINGRLDEMIAQAHGGVGLQHVTKGKLDNLAIVLPPLPEQRRIVAKVDELMALCDHLEARQQRRAEARARLNRSALHHFTAATDDAELAAHWERLQENFHLLYDTPETVAELRQAVLQLAVRGKLVPFDADAHARPLGSILAEGSLNGIATKPHDEPRGTPVLRISAGTSRQDAIVDETDHKYLKVDPDTIAKFRLAPGDLLACRFNGNLHYVGRLSLYTGSSGKIQIYPDKLIRFRVDPEQADPAYVRYAFNAPDTRAKIESYCATTAGNIGISAGRLKTIELPLPPLPEQQRIVAKVDELMALCDRMEARLTAARAKSTHLAASVVHHLAA